MDLNSELDKIKNDFTYSVSEISKKFDNSLAEISNKFDNTIKSINIKFEQCNKSTKDLFQTSVDTIMSKLDKSIDVISNNFIKLNSNVNNEITRLDKKIIDFSNEQDTKINKLKTELSNSIKSINNIQNVSDNNNKNNNDILSYKNECIRELADRQGKEKNLIIFGLKENTLQDSQDNKAEDKKQIIKIAESINTNVYPETLYTTRLNSQSGDVPRPLKIIFKDSLIRNAFLQGYLKNMHHPNLSGLNITQNRTRMQREAYKLAKVDLLRKREENTQLGGTAIYVIREIQGSFVIKKKQTSQPPQLQMNIQQ